MTCDDPNLTGPDEFTRLAEAQWNALEMARKADAAERRAEEAEYHVEQLRDARDRAEAALERLQADAALACEWCGQIDGTHDNGCRLGPGPDEQVVRLAQEEALRTAARAFVTEMGDTWGGDSSWMTTGNRVAEVVACVLREMADDLRTPPGLPTGGGES